MLSFRDSKYTPKFSSLISNTNEFMTSRTNNQKKFNFDQIPDDDKNAKK